MRKVSQKLCRASRKLSAEARGTLRQMRPISRSSLSRPGSFSSPAKASHSAA